MSLKNTLLNLLGKVNPRFLAAAEKGLNEIPELHVLGDPLFVIAFASGSLNIYKILDFMSHKKMEPEWAA